MKFIILGCGSSLGVPTADGNFGNCDPKNIKNFRTRCSALLQTKNENILIDTSPDLRQQLISNNIKKIDRVLYSHMHADQTHGINDLRVFFIRSKKKIPTYADKPTTKYLMKSFKYCFDTTNKFYPATLKLNKMKKIFNIKNGSKLIQIKSLSVPHGNVVSICYIIDSKLAYISDVSNIEKKHYKNFYNLNILVIDCLWYKFNFSHLNLERTLELVEKFKPKKTVLTNLHSTLDYNELNKITPKNVVPAYDGMKLEL